MPPDPADLVRVARVLAAEGLVEAFGHVSARISPREFLITPRMALRAVRAGELVRLRLEQQQDTKILKVVAGRKNTVPVEAMMHAALYAQRADVHAIVRDHGAASSAFGIGGRSPRPVHALGGIAGGQVPVFPSAMLISSWEQGRMLADALGDAAAVILRGNGRAVVGSSLIQACIRALFLEESARLELTVHAAGLPCSYLTEEEIAAAGRDLAGPAQLDRAWNHYLEKHHLAG